MSTFRHKFQVVLDGEPFPVQTTAADYTTAERQLGREVDKVNPESMQFVLRMLFVAFSRAYPDHPAARHWPQWAEQLDDMQDLEPKDDDAPGPLDPTQTADSAGWP